MRNNFFKYFFLITYPQAHVSSALKFNFLQKFCVKILFCKHYFSARSTPLWEKGKNRIREAQNNMRILCIRFRIRIPQHCKKPKNQKTGRPSGTCEAGRRTLVTMYPTAKRPSFCWMYTRCDGRTVSGVGDCTPDTGSAIFGLHFKQCCGSMTFRIHASEWWIRILLFFIIDLQDANKKLIKKKKTCLFITF